MSVNKLHNTLKKPREALTVTGTLLSSVCGTSARAKRKHLNTSETRLPTGIGARNAQTRHLCLWTLPLAVLFSFAVASNCNIELSQIASDASNPGTAQCGDGCDSCNFTLATGLFQYGTVECLAKVQCRITVDSTEDFAMKYVTVNGTQASALTVDSSNGRVTWWYSVFHGPQNGGNFRFDCSSLGCVHDTEFNAAGSGVVDIRFTNGGLDNSNYPELYSMEVLATKAERLNISFGADARFARNKDSLIKCPEFGACVWQSYGQRFDLVPDFMGVVNLLLFSASNLQYVCGNSEACAGVFVHCQEENCQMQYLADEWQCIGNLTLANNGNAWQCNALPTTTAVSDTSTVALDTSTRQPTTTTQKSTMTTMLLPTTPKPTNATVPLLLITTLLPNDTKTSVPLPMTSTTQDSGNKSEDSTLLYAAIACSLALVCCVLASAIGYFVGLKRSQKSARELPQVMSVSVEETGNALFDSGHIEGEGALEEGYGATAHVPQTAIEMGKCVAGVKSTVGGPVVGEGEDDDSEEMCELKEALRKVAKMKRDAGDEKFGEMLASMRVGNEILEGDVFEQMDGKPTAGGGAATGGREHSEERRALKDALQKVAKLKRDEGDEKFGRVLASMRVANGILQDDVFDQMDGMQETSGEGVIQSSFTDVLVAAQPEGGGEVKHMSSTSFDGSRVYGKRGDVFNEKAEGVIK